MNPQPKPQLDLTVIAPIPQQAVVALKPPQHTAVMTCSDIALALRDSRAPKPSRAVIPPPPIAQKKRRLPFLNISLVLMGALAGALLSVVVQRHLFSTARSLSDGPLVVQKAPSALPSAQPIPNRPCPMPTQGSIPALSPPVQASRPAAAPPTRKPAPAIVVRIPLPRMHPTAIEVPKPTLDIPNAEALPDHF